MSGDEANYNADHLTPCRTNYRPDNQTASSLAAPAGSALWEAYGPSRVPITFDRESFVGPTEINDVGGPLCVVSGATDEESLLKAKRIADLLNQYGLSARNGPDQRPGQ